MEEWKDIEGWEGKYQVSNYGDIKRLERDITDSLGRTKHYTEKIFHPHKANNGYTRVSFGTERDLTHRVVAKAFLPNPRNLPEVNNYEDGNLEWVDRKENMLHASRTGLINKDSKKRKISTALNQKKSVEKALRPVALLDDENNILSIFRSIKIAGEITNIPQQNIGEVCRGNRDSAGGFKWEYVDKDLFNTVTQEIV